MFATLLLWAYCEPEGRSSSIFQLSISSIFNCTLLNRKRSHHNFKKVAIEVCDEMTTGNLVGPARYWCQGKTKFIRFNLISRKYNFWFGLTPVTMSINTIIRSLFAFLVPFFLSSLSIHLLLSFSFVFVIIVFFNFKVKNANLFKWNVYLIFGPMAVDINTINTW